MEMGRRGEAGGGCELYWVSCHAPFTIPRGGVVCAQPAPRAPRTATRVGRDNRIHDEGASALVAGLGGLAGLLALDLS